MNGFIDLIFRRRPKSKIRNNTWRVLGLLILCVGIASLIGCRKASDVSQGTGANAGQGNNPQAPQTGPAAETIIRDLAAAIGRSYI